jgi:protein-tyrosine phosphatase
VGSDCSRPTGDPLQSTMMHVPGCRAVLDLGGLRTASGATTRRGVLFRGDRSRNVDESSAAALVRLGVETVIDLRTDREAKKRPALLRGVPGILHEHVELGNELQTPGFVGIDSLWPLYQALVDVRARQFVQLAEAVAAMGGRPTLFHCAAGRDRTGLAAAVLLEVLGVSRRDVIRQQRMVCEAIAPDVADRRRRWIEKGRLAEDFDRFNCGEIDALTMALARIDERYGSAVDMLLRHGADPDLPSYLRSHLLEVGTGTRAAHAGCFG